MSKEQKRQLRSEARHLDAMGFPIHKIAEKLGLTEFETVRLLGKNY